MDSTFEPISRPAKKLPKTPLLKYYGSAFLFTFILVYVSVSLVLVQIMATGIIAAHYPAMLLLPNQKEKVRQWFYSQYRSVIVITERSFGSMCVFLCAILTPGTELVLTGDHELMKECEKAILMSNHQIYPDWLYLWMLARQYGRHGDLKIMLIAVMQYLPVFGLGMTFFEFIFMKQKLAKDRSTIIKAMDRQKNLWKDFPLWLLIFPEGTLNTPNNRVTSRAYAKKTDMSEDPKFVILPKGTGLFMVADALIDQVDSLFDLTVGYSGLEAEDIPYDEYLIDKVYFDSYYPKQIHIDVKKYSLKTLPGLDKSVVPAKDANSSAVRDKAGGAFDQESNERRLQLSAWVKDRFMEKDERMKTFYEKGAFDGPCTRITIKPTANDWFVVGSVCASSWVIIPLWWNIFKTIIVSLYHLIF
ncbi:hypothetical protein HDU91_004246 [Kappamyces sp. JEL0680]|nr:hypothetical protein HDU91_004246 [Kappamyces sp. JEL0680]